MLVGNRLQSRRFEQGGLSSSNRAEYCNKQGNALFKDECIKFFRFENVPIINRRRCAIPDLPEVGFSSRIQIGGGISEIYKIEKAKL